MYYPTARVIKAEQLVGKDGDADTLESHEQDIDFAQWAGAQVRNLRLRLGFQVADKGVAGVLVELHNRGRAGRRPHVLVERSAYMAWLNELGATAVAGRTQDVDLAARQDLKLGASPTSVIPQGHVTATKLGFSPVPGMPSQAPSTSLKVKGREGLRVDLLVHGQRNSANPVPVPQLMWHAEAVPH